LSYAGAKGPELVDVQLLTDVHRSIGSDSMAEELVDLRHKLQQVMALDR
jgi:hypothetical protein